MIKTRDSLVILGIAIVIIFTFVLFGLVSMIDTALALKPGVGTWTLVVSRYPNAESPITLVIPSSFVSTLYGWKLNGQPVSGSYDQYSGKVIFTVNQKIGIPITTTYTGYLIGPPNCSTSNFVRTCTEMMVGSATNTVRGSFGWYAKHVTTTPVVLVKPKVSNIPPTVAINKATDDMGFEVNDGGFLSYSPKLKQGYITFNVQINSNNPLKNIQCKLDTVTVPCGSGPINLIGNTKYTLPQIKVGLLPDVHTFTIAVTDSIGLTSKDTWKFTMDPRATL